MTTPGWTDRDVPSQTGRTALVTGANSGIGLETARQLAQRGARVLLACRNPEKGEATLRALRAGAPGSRLEVVPLDLADLGSVRACAAQVRAKVERLDILVNNAGLMAVPASKTKDGFEMQLGTNHLGHFALTGALLPVLDAAPAARVVNVTSLYHRFGRLHVDDLMHERRPYKKWDAYSESKLANVLFTFELARRLAAAKSRIVATAAHPGYAATNLQGVGPALEGSKLLALVMKASNALFAQSAAAGAWPSLRAATDPSAEPGDVYGPAGFGAARGPAVKVDVSPAARDEAGAKLLWEASVRLTGERFGGL